MSNVMYDISESYRSQGQRDVDRIHSIINIHIRFRKYLRIGNISRYEFLLSGQYGISVIPMTVV